MSQTRKCFDKCKLYSDRKAFLQHVEKCLCHKEIESFNKDLDIQNKLTNKQISLGFRTQVKFQFYKQTFMGNKYYNLIQGLNVSSCLKECLLDSTTGCIGVSTNLTNCFLYKDLIYSKEKNQNIDSYILPYSLGFTVNSFALKSYYFNVTEKTLEACIKKCLIDHAKCDYITYRQFKSINDLTCKFSSTYFNSQIQYHIMKNNQIETDANEDLYEDIHSSILILNPRKKHYDLYVMNGTRFVSQNEDPNYSFYTQNSLQCWHHCDVDVECQAASYLQNYPLLSIEYFSNCFLFKKGVGLQVNSNSKWESYINVKGFEKMSSMNIELNEHFIKNFFLFSPNNQLNQMVNLTDCLEFCSNTDNCMSVLFDKSNLNCTLFKGVPSNSFQMEEETNQPVDIKRENNHHILLINTNRGKY